MKQEDNKNSANNKKTNFCAGYNDYEDMIQSMIEHGVTYVPLCHETYESFSIADGQVRVVCKNKGERAVHAEDRALLFDCINSTYRFYHGYRITISEDLGEVSISDGRTHDINYLLLHQPEEEIEDLISNACALIDIVKNTFG